MSQLDYGCQLCSPYLIKHIPMVEKVQSSFTRFISGMMEGMSYPETYCFEAVFCVEERDTLLFMCGRFRKVWSLISSLLYVLKHWIVEGGPVSRHTLMLDDWEHWSITALGGVPSVCLTNYLCLYVIPLYVLFIVSRNNWIAIYLQCLILRVNEDSTTAWIMEIV